MAQGTRNSRPISAKLLFCPNIGEVVEKQIDKEFMLPNARVVWWQCEACGGWHLIITSLLEEVDANAKE